MSASAARGFTTTPDETLDQILEYAKRGWCLFPCVRRRQTPLICSWRDFASCDPNYERQCKTRPQCAARAEHCGGVKVVHRRNLVP